MPEPAPDELLTAEELLEAGPVIEASTRIVVPKRGQIFEEDGTCKVAVIRPCVSKGKRLKGLPPIYTPRMLAEHAAVYSGWLMYADHLSEEVVEVLKKRGRSIRELGGRMIKTWWDPEFRRKDDDEYGYRPGAVIGQALPQPPIRAMLEADPEILHVSHNAWPKSARVGTAPWAPGIKGMLIEGIRDKPEGSVDWVPRGGAGGHVLQEDVDLAVSLLEAYYDAADADENLMPSLKNITAKKLREQLAEDAPELLEELGLAEEDEDTKPKPAAKPAAKPEEEETPAPAKPKAETGITQEQLQEALDAQKTELTEDFENKLSEKEEEFKAEAQDLVEGRDTARAFEKKAHAQIKAAGLPRGWQTDLIRRYSVLPSGPSPALLAEEKVTEEGETMTAEQVLEERVTADLEHAVELIQESGGKPRVTGLGRTAPDRNSDTSQKKGKAAAPAWRADMGLKLEEGQSEDDGLREALSEVVD